MGFGTLISLSIIAFASVTAYPSGPNEVPGVCGYESCPKGKPGMLNVHLIAHTHDDVGWLKTVDQYYFGSHPQIQKAGVQYILDSVIQALLHDPNKRFIYVETAFLWKWWMRQHDTVRHQVKKLINSGQLEIVGGGWSMNDEAVTNYMSTIDQMTWGFRKLNDTFGSCGRPKIGWQIDPFGHSRDMASTFALLGFDGLFFSRLDYIDKMVRMNTKTAEMLWEGSPNLGKKSWLFTGVLYNHYAPPPGFCFDLLCDDEPIVDDKHSPDYNVDERVSAFNFFVENQSKYYSTENIAVTMGGDFNYQDANSWFTNLDKLIRYTNEKQESDKSRVNVFYSTPSCYLKSLHESNKTWPTKDDDFFPYASDPHSYWTGYYTSRPTLKYFERLGNNFLQICKQLYVIGELGPEDQVDLNAMREAMGVMQHHDAITGTEKQAVAKDYARILSNGFAECQAVASAAIQKIINKSNVEKQKDRKDLELEREVVDSGSDEVPTVNITSCLLLNISQCAISEGSDPFVVTVYNPQSRNMTHTVRVPVSGAAYSVKDSKGADVPAQIIPIPPQVMKIPGRMSQAVNEIVFKTDVLPPVGFKSYHVSRGNKMMKRTEYIKINGHQKKRRSQNVLRVGQGDLKVGVGADSGLIEWVERGSMRVPVKQEFLYYQAMEGDNAMFSHRASGAYIFRPNGSEPIPVLHKNAKVTAKVYKGELVDEIHQQFSDWVSQVIKVYKDENYVEFNWVVGPIPIEDKIGKEVICRFSTGIESNGVFYTDSNGREMLKRKRRIGFEDYNPFVSNEQDPVVEPIAGNYYPVTSRIRISGSNNGQPMVFTVLTDRAQGGSSIKDGQIELMLHRRLLHDDAFGVGEALNEMAYGTGLVARGQHFVVVGPMDATSSPVYAEEREIALTKLMAPWLFFSKATSSYNEWMQNSVKEFQAINDVLPRNIHVLTLEPWKGNTVLFRLEHFYEMNEDPVLSKPVTLNLKELLAWIQPTFIRETTLGANQWIDDSRRLVWKSESNNITDEMNAGEEMSSAEDSTSAIFDPSNVVMGPMDIRTFIIGLS